MTLTATESASDGTTPAGTVQFGVGGTDIGAAVAVNAAGMATTTTTFAATGSDALWALFVPTSLTYSASEATLSLTVTAAAGSMPLLLTVSPHTGTVTRVTALPDGDRTPGSVTLVASETAANGTHPAMLVQFEADGTDIGGAVSLDAGGIASTSAAVSAGASAAVSAAFTLTSTAYGASAATDSAPIAPGNPGLGSAGAVLATAAPGSGSGTDTLTAELMLAVPSGAEDGPGAGTLTITFVDAGPQPMSYGIGLPSAG